MKDPNNFQKNLTSGQNTNAPTFLLMLSYCAVLFNFSATITSLILIDKLGELRLRASRDPDLQGGDGEESLNEPRRIAETSLKLLERFGAGESWRWMMWHCEYYQSLNYFVKVPEQTTFDPQGFSFFWLVFCVQLSRLWHISG